MQNIYETFEFDKIKNFIAEYTKTEYGKELTFNLSQIDDVNLLIYALDELKEIVSLVFRFGPLPILSSADALKLIDIAKKTALLSPRDLNLIANDIETINNIISYTKKIGLNYPLLNKRISGFIDLSSLYHEIHRVITPSLTVSDNASSRLKEIRHKLKTLESAIQDRVTAISYKYADYLSDSNATIRDGHFVLPVKTVYKSKVVGAIYDISDTGNTTFIEPLEIISLNNEITSLKVEENEEVRKILKELTSLVLLQEEEIIKNNRIIGEIDFLVAKAMYAKDINGAIAEFTTNEQVINLKNARHPLIDKEKVVSNSYYLDEEKRMIIISGPNAGGKTVSLKTIGLLVLMNQCGLAIPVEEAKLSYFKHIYVDIGDNQSLSDNLSTFSAHMSHIAEILASAKGKDLVLIDELGTGTDPKEGEAIALGVSKALLRAHSFTCISSHFSSLKEFALTNPNIENSSMIFDEENLKPTYIFKLGIPGKSYGLEVASRYGIKKEVLEEAKEYLNNKYSSKSDELIVNLQKKVESTIKLEKELKEEKLRYERENKRLEIDEINLENKREKLLSSVKEEKERLIEDTKKKIDEIIKLLGNSDMKLHDVIALKQKVDALEEESGELETFNEDININDYVYVPSLELNGKVDRINGNKCHIISDNGINLSIEKNLVKKAERKEIKVINKTKHNIEINTKSVPIELNIIGLHVDEANNALVKYIDDCRMKHMAKVRIIHGFGSGALRKMTHEYLAKQKDLSFRLGDGSEGGGGATVVTFNDR